MEASLESIRGEVQALRKDVEFIMNILKEDYELSDEAKEALRAARETPEVDYVDLE